MSDTKAIFIPGVRFRVKQDFKSGPTSKFAMGEIVVYDREAYSPYDNRTVYVFRGEAGNDVKEWWLPDGQSQHLWREYFEPV
jgi:hypothetical protein